MSPNNLITGNILALEPEYTRILAIVQKRLVDYLTQKQITPEELQEQYTSSKFALVAGVDVAGLLGLQERAEQPSLREIVALQVAIDYPLLYSTRPDQRSANPDSLLGYIHPNLPKQVLEDLDPAKGGGIRMGLFVDDEKRMGYILTTGGVVGREVPMEEGEEALGCMNRMKELMYQTLLDTIDATVEMKRRNGGADPRCQCVYCQILRGQITREQVADYMIQSKQVVSSYRPDNPNQALVDEEIQKDPVLRQMYGQEPIQE